MTLNQISNIIVHKFMRSLGFISSSLPMKYRGKIGEMLGDLMRLLGKSRRRIAMINLNIAFPTKEKSELKSIMIASFRNLGITFLEMAALRRMNSEDVKEIITLNNHQIINDAIAKGNGVILLSGHYANWEYVALAAGLYSGIPITIVVQHQKNKLIDSDINFARTKFGNKVVSMNSAARTLIQALRENTGVALLADQSAKFGKDAFADFFGKPALTFEAPAELALKYRSPILYAFPIRNKDYTYTAELKELDFSDLEYSKENVKELTKRHITVLEAQIIEQPEFWAWQHRRWKHSVEY